MQNLILARRAEEPYNPEVNFNAQTGECLIKGESYMEEPHKFYLPLIEWIDDLIDMNKPVKLNLKLMYFNTSTSKMILQLLNLLKKYIDNGGKVEVNWYYDEDDEDMKEEIEDYIIECGIDITKLPMN